MSTYNRFNSAQNFKVTVCANYIEGGSATSSNMAVMEIFLPSGYTVDRDSLYALRRYKGVKRVDPEVGDTKVRLKFVKHFYTSLNSLNESYMAKQ